MDDVLEKARNYVFLYTNHKNIGEYLKAAKRDRLDLNEANLVWESLNRYVDIKGEHLMRLVIVKKERAICTKCNLRTTDGCGPNPGRVMICSHPHFKHARFGVYDAAIIAWETIDGIREAVSYQCPKKNEEKYYYGKL